TASPSERDAIAPLPGWRLTESHADTVALLGLTLHRRAFAAVDATGREVTGAATDAVSSPDARALGELVERICVIEATRAERPLLRRAEDGSALGFASPSEVFPTSPDPAEWRHALSNGCALGATFGDASARAFAELVERDRWLAAWVGQ